MKITKSRRVGAIVLGLGGAQAAARGARFPAGVAHRVRGLGILPWEGGAAESLARLRYFAASTAALDALSLSDAASPRTRRNGSAPVS